MILEEITAGYIYLSLSGDDWKMSWREFIEGLKKAIPPEDREWTSDKKWIIRASDKNIAEISRLKQKYLTNPGQMSLF